MTAVSVRFVLTGACYVSYSGRQVQLEVPITQPNGNRTTVADVEAQVRRDWPKDLDEMADTITTIPMRFLKTGRLLKSDDIFEEQLTKAELAECEVVDGDAQTAEEVERSSVLMHIAFQRERPQPETRATTGHTSAKKGKAATECKQQAAGSGRNSSTAAPANGGGGHEVKDDNCCCAM